MKKIKVFAISDLHLSINSNKPMNVFGPVWDNYLTDIETSFKKKVKPNDIVLIPGDISWAMKLADAVADLNYIGSLPGKKIIIKGNHDYWWASISAVRNELKPNMYAIQNDCLKFDNLLFCGTRGWVIPEGRYNTPEDEKIYKREAIRLELTLKDMAKRREKGDKVFVLMHYPPFTSRSENTEFTRLLEEYKVDYVIYGHLHKYDNLQIEKFVTEKNGIKYFLTSCDLVENKLTEIK